MITRSIKPTGHKALDRALRALRATLGGLDGTDGRPVARRNARRRVLAAVRALRAAVDRDWPAIVVRKKAQRLKTLDGRLARLQRRGWCMVPGSKTGTLAAYAAAGVPIRRITGVAQQERVVFDAQGRPMGRTPAGAPQIYYLVPRWAAAVGPDAPARLRALKGDRQGQQAAIAAAMLMQ